MRVQELLDVYKCANQLAEPDLRWKNMFGRIEFITLLHSQSTFGIVDFVGNLECKSG